MRYFPDKQPVGINPDGQAHTFWYLVETLGGVSFRSGVRRMDATDDAVQEARARRVLPAPDQRGERTVPRLNFVHRLEPDNVPVHARLSPKNLPDERARDIAETMSDLLAAVLSTDPDWTTLPARAPAPICKLLRRCLEKDRKRRLDSAPGVFRERSD